MPGGVSERMCAADWGQKRRLTGGRPAGTAGTSTGHIPRLLAVMSTIGADRVERAPVAAVVQLGLGRVLS